MEAADIRRLRELEDENRRLKPMYADLSSENRALKRCDRKKALKPAAKRELAATLQAEHGLSELRLVPQPTDAERFHRKIQSQLP